MYKLASILQCLVLLMGENKAPPNFSDKSDTIKPPELLDQVRDKLRVEHYSIRPEQTCVDWIKRHINFHGKQSPSRLGYPRAPQQDAIVGGHRDVAQQLQAVKDLQVIRYAGVEVRPEYLGGRAGFGVADGA